MKLLRILLTGSSGQIGFELHRTLSTLGLVEAPSHAELDLLSADSIQRALHSFHPNIIVNAAAYTAVDRAESEPEKAMRVNSDSSGLLATEAKKMGAAIIHYSTDYVFDGTSQTPYVEDAQTNPLNVYGKSKLDGEQKIAEANGAFLILRTSWVYGARGNNFLKTMIRLAKEQRQLKIVNDQLGAPTSSRAIADATSQVVAQCLSGSRDIYDGVYSHRGVYHMTCQGQTSWYEFAREIFQRLVSPIPEIVPILTSDYPTPAKRPHYSILSNKKLNDRFRLSLPSWQTALARVVEELT